MFGPVSIYNPINSFFLIGFLLPLAFYYLKKSLPQQQGREHPVTMMMFQAMPYNYTNWLVLDFAFQFFARGYYLTWHLRYTYVMFAAFDSGVALTGVLSFFMFTIHDKCFLEW